MLCLGTRLLESALTPQELIYSSTDSLAYSMQHGEAPQDWTGLSTIFWGDRRTFLSIHT